ncbi:SDR family oxidoreductase [Paenibacillus sp.]|uniref:SDR family NAD(P)-dependent oxidoreductase n=1 Tax=Paenibacillus sp. TaxID=58172 RepID=UPI002D27D555|nr:SDR family oxidoreductase [Paenibacillus sp.]HZG57532.1 SDR family oxidoreductase [Paenibacillus sp.]
MTIRTYEGKTAVVTGASGGIGAEIAKRLHAAGADVVLAARSVDKLETLAASIGPRAHAMALDVGDEADVRRFFAEARARFGDVDVLVNNAGFGLFERVVDATPEAFASMMNVNYFGVVRCTKAVLPRMLERRAGSVVNVASIAGKMGTAKSAGYSATKHAVLGFTNSLRQEIHGSGVHIMAVNPGPVSTGFFDIADPSGGYVNGVRWMMVTPERVAQETLRGLARRKAEVNVPSWLGVAAGASQALPIGLVNAFAARFLNLK